MLPSDPLPTLPAFIAERLSYPRSIALAERVGGRTRALSAADVHRRAAAVAYALRARGIGHGDRVALVAQNRVDWLVADFGILYAGAVVVPVFATSAEDQLGYILADSGAKLVFVDDVAAVARLGAAVPDSPPLIALDAPEGTGFDALVAAGEALFDADPSALATFSAAVNLDDLAVLIYTSGTTGTPKGVMLSHRNLIADVVDAFDPAISGLEEGQLGLSILPLAHIFEHTDALGYLYNLLIHYISTPEHLLEDMRALRPHYIAVVPRVFERLLAGIVVNARSAGGAQARLVPWALDVGTAYERALRDGHVPPLLRAQHALAHALVLKRIKPVLGLDRLRYFVSGSAPLHRDIALTFAGMGVPIAEGYGLTETSPVVTANPPGAIRYGSVGKAIDGVQIKIAADGEILVKGPNVMQGYYHLPAEHPFDADGWFRTGDIGELDRDGYLFITDRKKELIKTSTGKYIAPGRVEAALKRSIYIGQCFVIGDGRSFPLALVSPNWDLVRKEFGISPEVSNAAIAERTDVRDFMTNEVIERTADLSSFEQIRKVALLPRDLTVEDGELSPTLKVKRRVVEKKFADLIDAAYQGLPAGAAR